MATTATSLKNSEIDDGKKLEGGSRMEFCENSEAEECGFRVLGRFLEAMEIILEEIMGYKKENLKKEENGDSRNAGLRKLYTSKHSTTFIC